MNFPAYASSLQISQALASGLTQVTASNTSLSSLPLPAEASSTFWSMKLGFWLMRFGIF